MVICYAALRGEKRRSEGKIYSPFLRVIHIGSKNPSKWLLSCPGPLQACGEKMHGGRPINHKTHYTTPLRVGPCDQGEAVALPSLQHVINLLGSYSGPMAHLLPTGHPTRQRPPNREHKIQFRSTCGSGQGGHRLSRRKALASLLRIRLKGLSMHFHQPREQVTGLPRIMERGRMSQGKGYFMPKLPSH